MKNKGFALGSALMVMLLLFALGVASMMVARFGFEIQSVEIGYLKAKNAAEHGLMVAIENLVLHSRCTFATSGPVNIGDGSQYEFNMTPDQTNRNCFIWSQGSFAGARVVKTMIIPFSLADYGAMDVRNNPSITLSGSSSIASCDSNCPGPALAYGGTLSFSGVTSTQCSNNNRGIVGSPAIISTDIQDRIPKYFCKYVGETCSEDNPCNRNPEASKASDRNEFFDNIYQRFSDKLRIHGMDTLTSNGNFQDFDTIGTSLKNNLPVNCKYTDNKDCTLSGSTITCGSGNQAQTINLNICASGVYIQTNLNLSGNLPANSRIFVNGSTTIGANATLNGSTIISKGNVTVGNVELNSGYIVSYSDITIRGSTTNVNFFTDKNLIFDPQGGNKRISGGFFYSRGDTKIDSQGNYKIGDAGNCINQQDNPVPGVTEDQNAKPVFIVAGGNLDMSGQGGANINGFILTWGSQVSIKGDFTINGSFVVNNDTNLSITNDTGNATLNFNYCINETLRKYIYCGLLKPIRCSAGTTALPGLLRTKATQF